MRKSIKRVCTLALAVVAAVAVRDRAAFAQELLPPSEFGPPQEQDPFAKERLQQCRDLGSFAVVDPPRDRSGVITVSPGSPCADLLSLQPSWLPYLQLNVDVGGGRSLGGSLGPGEDDARPGGKNREPGGKPKERWSPDRGGWKGWQPHQDHRIGPSPRSTVGVR
jgi:hypothetical protein